MTVQPRRLIVTTILIVALVAPASVFAGVGIGAAAYSDTPILAASDVNRDLLDGSFSFGANGRIKFDSLMLDALGLYATGEESIDLYLTAQLTGDFLSFLRLSAGIGPAIRFPLASNDEISVDWINAKFDADLILFKRFSVGLSFQYLIPSSDVNAIDLSRARGRIGASALIW